MAEALLNACMYVCRLSRQRTHLCICLDPHNTSLPRVQGWQPHAQDCRVRPTQVIRLAGAVAAALQAAKGVHKATQLNSVLEAGEGRIFGKPMRQPQGKPPVPVTGQPDKSGAGCSMSPFPLGRSSQH